MANYNHSELTGNIIKAFYKVYNKLGYGFLEKIYESAMMIELKNIGISCIKQHPFKVYYDGIEIGNYFADILAQNKVILESKVTENIFLKHEAQLLNYLKATKIEVGLILNFDPEPQIARRIFENKNK